MWGERKPHIEDTHYRKWRKIDSEGKKTESQRENSGRVKDRKKAVPSATDTEIGFEKYKQVKKGIKMK